MSKSNRKSASARRRDGERSESVVLPSDRASGDDVAVHRLRQASVASILDQLFGPFGASDPKLWERRAYLLLVGSVYERLAADADLSTDELVKLARVLAEHRRSKSPSKSGDSESLSSGAQGAGDGPLPDRFAEMVRDLYGTSLDEGVARQAPETSHAVSQREYGGVGG